MALKSQLLALSIYLSFPVFSLDLSQYDKLCDVHFAANAERHWKVKSSFNFLYKSETYKLLLEELKENTQAQPFRLYIEINPHIDYVAFLLETTNDDYCVQTYHSEHGNHVEEAGECVLPEVSNLLLETKPVKAENTMSSAIGAVLYIEQKADKTTTALCNDRNYHPFKFFGKALLKPRLEQLRTLDQKSY
ncbi:hypothetical protein A5320_00690 [Rheinheimera sp. SA_1]|uniref:hypothetical protein n=1 Tax=Rheinheimera sp. SA_1 TaxID=1827365 RepID=UPI0007FCE18A|nr:hypothetical protein [Rheinheimera sp. SA_1]OBP15991.1 hypothetical protein A5320_00690 [Rheinheimera sp. SA_1]